MRILIFIGLTLLSCNHSNIAQDKVENYFTTQINIVENYLSTGKSKGLELDKAVIFLEKLTNIKSNISEGYDDDIKLPNRYNVEDWKVWYKLNKSNLYWDTKKNEILIHGNAKLIAKDPNLEYKRFLNIIKKYKKSDSIDIDDLNYAVHFITNLTNIKDSSYNFLPNTELPQKEIIQKWENWFKQNQKFLFWDKKEQKIKVKDTTPLVRD